MAGLERMDITGGRKNEIEYRIYKTLRQTGGRKIILSPGCVIPVSYTHLDVYKRQDLYRSLR